MLSNHDLKIRIGADSSGLATDMRRAGGILSAEAQRIGGGLTSQFDAAGRAAGAALARGLGVLVSGAAVAGTVRLADEYNSLQGRLDMVTRSERERTAVQQQLLAMSERQRVALSSTTDLYVKAAAARDELGASEADLLRFVEGTAAGLRVGAAGASAQAGALMQLSQAIGGTLVQAEEYNSLLDGARPILQAVADNLDGAGGSISRLTAMVKDGEVSSRAFFQAFLAGSDKVIDQSADLPTSVSQALAVAETRLMQYIGAGNQATGVTAGLADGILLLSKHLDLLAAAAGGGGVLLLSRSLAALALSTQRSVVDSLAAARAKQAEGAAAQALALQTQQLSAARAADAAAAAQQAAQQAAAAVRQAEFSAAVVALKRSETAAQIEATRATLVAAQADGARAAAQVAAARGMGALSHALAAVRSGEAALAAAEAQRSQAQAALNVLTQRGTVLGLEHAGALRLVASAQQQAAAAQTSAAAASATSGAAAATATAAVTAAAARQADALRTTTRLAGVAGGALAALGGPLGLVTTALGLGAAAWIYYGSQSQAGGAQAAESFEDAGRRIRAELDDQIAKLELRARLSGKPGAAAQGFEPSDDQLKRLDDISRKIAEINGRAGQVGSSQAALDAVQVQALSREYAGIVQQIQRIADLGRQQTSGSVAGITGEYLKRYANDAERLATELQTARQRYAELGAALPPEVERRIRASFSADSVKAFDRAQQDLRETLLEVSGLTGSFQAQWDRLAALYRSGAIDLGTLERAQQDLLKQQPAVQAGLQAEAAARQAAADEARRWAEVMDAVIRGHLDEVQALDEQIRRQQDSNAEIGLSTEALRALELQRLADAEAMAVQQHHARLLAGAGQDELAAIQQRIARLQELIRLRRSGADRQAEVDRAEAAARSAQDAAREWDRAADQIERSITDALIRGFEGGEGLGRSMAQTLSNVLKAELGRAIIGPIARSLAQAVQVAMGSVAVPGGATAGAAGGAGALQALGVLGNVQTAVQSVHGILPGLAGNIGNLSSALGGLAGSQTLGLFGVGIKGATLAPGLAGPTTSGATGAVGAGAQLGQLSQSFAPYIGSILSAVQGDLKGAALSAIGTAIGTAVGGPIGGTIGSVLGSLASGLLGSKTPYLSGGAYTATATGPGYRPTGGADLAGFNLEDFNKRGNASLDEAAKGLAVGLGAAYSGILQALGSQAAEDITIGFRQSTERTKSFVRIGDDAAKVFERKSGDVQANLSAFADFSAAAIVQELQAAGLPQWADSIIDAIDPTKGVEALQEAAQSIGLIIDAAQRFRDLPISNLGTVTESTIVALAQLAGGLESLQGGLSAYYDAFYSQEERAATARAGLGRQLADLATGAPATVAAGLRDLSATLLGTAGATSISREEFRVLLESLDPNASATRALYVQLLGLAPAFADLVPATQAATDAVTDLVDESARAAEVARERQGLERQLLELQGNTTALRAMERAELFASNRTLYDQVQALRDRQDAEERQAGLRTQLADVQQAALGKVADAEERVSQLRQQAADRMRQFGGSLRDFVAGLNAQRLGADGGATAAAQFATLTAQARAGDVSAQQRLTGVAQALIDARRASATTEAEALQAQASVQASLLQTATLMEAQAAMLAGPAQTPEQELASAMAEQRRAQAQADAITQQLTRAGVDLQQSQLTELEQVRQLLADYTAAGRVIAAAPVVPAPVQAAAAPAGIHRAMLQAAGQAQTNLPRGGPVSLASMLEQSRALSQARAAIPPAAPAVAPAPAQPVLPPPPPVVSVPAAASLSPAHLAAQVSLLRQDLAALLAESRAVERAARRTADTLDDVADGDRLRTVADA